MYGMPTAIDIQCAGRYCKIPSPISMDVIETYFTTYFLGSTLFVDVSHR